MEQIAVVESTPNEETKKIIINMLHKFKFEAKNDLIQVPLEDYEERILYYTGISNTTLQEILEKNETAVYPKPNIIDFKTHLIILESLSQIYERKELPTFGTLFQKMKCHFNLKELIGIKIPNAKEFKQYLSMLGIGYQTIHNDRKLLLEEPKITFERFSYLRKMRKIRQQENYEIYYIGERIIDQDHNFNNPWKRNGQVSNICSGQCVLFHVVSNRTGFVNGLFCFSATEDDFYKWVVDILLGSLNPSSIVVLDNSPLHGTIKSKSLTMLDTKSDLIQWLQMHNVPCSDSMNKSELYQLFKNHADIEELPRVDRVIKANGHQVLRLPTHFEDLSPLDLIWKNIKRNLVHENDLHEEILKVFANISSETYKSYETKMKNRENALFSLDTNMDNFLEYFLSDLKQWLNQPSTQKTIQK